MKFRAFFHAVVLLAAAFPAGAQVRVAAPAAGAGAVSAAGAVAPLRYQLVLTSPSPSLNIGGAFLKDGAAQQWLSANRPAQFPALIRRALALQDWEQVLTMHDDPRLLREAILSRPDARFAQEPGELLAMVDRTPELAAQRPKFEQAVLDWKIFGEKTRAALAKDGATESSWSRLTLNGRYAHLRSVYQGMAGDLITVGPGDPDYPAQYEAALERVGALMTDAEGAEHAESLARAKRLAAGLSRAEKAVAAGDAEAAALLVSARRAEDLAAGENILSTLARRLGFPEPASARAPAYDLSPAETRALLARLTPAIIRAVKDTAIGDEILAAAPGLAVSIGVTSSQSALAHYDGGIVLGGRQLARMAADMGRSPRDLLTDDEAVADAAVIYSHLYVHEATHHRQHLWGLGLPLTARPLAYNHLSEVEANNAQAVFLRQKRAADPDFAAREARLREVGGLVGGIMTQPEALAQDPGRMDAWLSHGYTRVATLARAGARMIDAGMLNDRTYAGAAERIDAELARRGRRPSVERLELERRGFKDDYPRSVPLSRLATSELRRLRAAMRGQTDAMIEAARALQARAFAELRKLAL